MLEHGVDSERHDGRADLIPRGNGVRLRPGDGQRHPRAHRRDCHRLRNLERLRAGFVPGNAIAVILLVTIIPIMAYNIRNFQAQEAIR